MSLQQKIVEVEHGALVRVRRDDDDPRRAACAQPLEQQIREKEGCQVVHREHLFEAVGRFVPARAEHAGVADEDVESRVSVEHLGGRASDGLERAHVALNQLDRSGRGTAQLLGDRLRLLQVPVDHHDARAHIGKRARGLLTDARRCAGDHNDLALHRAHASGGSAAAPTGASLLPPAPRSSVK